MHFKLSYFIVVLCSLQRHIAAVDKLGSYAIDPNAISVSGLSAGAFMAVQLHVADSEMFMGVGVVAGGPFYCAKNSLMTALTPCMTTPSLIDVDWLVGNAENQVPDNVDDLSNLFNSKVYLYGGTRDTVVVQGVVKKAETLYNSFVNPNNIETEYDIASEHGFPTMNNGGTCGRKETETYINDCDYDGAYHILNHIYVNLKTPDYSLTAPRPAGSLLTFDQSEFLNVLNPNSIGMDDVGYLFVPDTCSDGTKGSHVNIGRPYEQKTTEFTSILLDFINPDGVKSCRLHVSLHGCKQGKEFIGDTYPTETGYNEVAAINDIIVIYPQSHSVPLSNPNGCFDWWGYTDGDYAYKGGVQMVAIKDMVKRLISGSLPTETSTTTLGNSLTTSTFDTATTTTTTSSASESGVLGSYNIDTSAISVSGLSSGASMAIQMHVAYSDTIMGAGAVAGAPYYCAMNNIGIATTYCMYMPYMISVSLLESKAEEKSSDGSIANLSNLRDDQVYLFSGTKDTVVTQGVVEKAEEFYSDYVSNIATEYSIPAQNGFPTMNKGGDCDSKNKNGINNCGYDAAYQMLAHIYGEGITMPVYNDGKSPQGRLLEFSQTEFTELSDPSSIGLNDKGYVYVPDSCETKTTACRVHIAFHGCKHGDDSVAEAFANDAGYNDVADLNNIIVLYPQSALMPIQNPQDCWDWWGYTNSDYAFSNGEQLTAIMNMVSRLIQ